MTRDTEYNHGEKGRARHRHWYEGLTDDQREARRAKQRETWHARRKHLRFTFGDEARYFPAPLPVTLADGRRGFIEDPEQVGLVVQMHLGSKLAEFRARQAAERQEWRDGLEEERDGSAMLTQMPELVQMPDLLGLLAS